MATSVTYNGIVLHNVLTRKWEQEIYYDESGTDEVGQKLSLQFEAILHKQRVPIQDSTTYVDTGPHGSFGGDSIFEALQIVQSQLGKPRRNLTVTVDNQTVVHVIPAEVPVQPNADIENGPKPKVLSITPIGGKAFRITFAVDTVVGNCDGSRGSHQLLISTRSSLS